MPILPSIRVAAAVFLVSLSAAACGKPADAPAPAPAAVVTASEVTGTVPKNAVVSLLLAAADAPMPGEPAVMDQYSKQFVPNLLYVRVGQKVEFRNSEDMPHNVIVSRRGTGAQVFNVGTEPHEKHVHAFDRVGQYDVICDIHPGMQATVVATRSSMATVAGDDGGFTLPNVPLGSYMLSLVFEGRTVEQALEVTGARTVVTIAR